MKKKILLVVPNFRWKDEQKSNILWHYIPYGLCMLAAVLGENETYNVKILDAYKENMSRENFAKYIEQMQPDVVGLTVLIDYFGCTLHMAAEIIKSVNSNIKIIGGGVYVTTNIEKVLSDKNVDYVIAGEGEYTLPILLENIFTKTFPTEQGIYYLDEMGKIQGSGRSKLIKNLDDLPFPNYHLINYEDYIYEVSRNSVDRPEKLPYAEIFTSRGCPHRCCFCQVRHIIGQNFRPRSAENVLQEIDWLMEEYGIRSVVIMDDNFLAIRKRAIKIMQGLAERNLEWKMIATAVFMLDDEILEIMAKSGCKYIDVAVESGTYRVLHDVIHKPIKSFEQVKKAVRKAQSLEIYVAANFIIGFPSETWNEIRQTIKFAEELNADYVKLFNAVPLPHTEMYEECLKKHCLTADYDSENIEWRVGFIETDEFSREDLTILRAYEWDRINFTDEDKRKRTAQMMHITEAELNEIRKNTRRTVQDILKDLELANSSDN